MNRNFNILKQMSKSKREEIQEKIDFQSFKSTIDELTCVPLIQQIQSENSYLQIENQILHMRLSKDDTTLYPITPINYIILYEYAQKLAPQFLDWLTIIKYKDLKIIAEHYKENPPLKKSNQVTFEDEKLIVDFAIQNISWGSPRITYTLKNLCVEDISENQVANAIKRNNIPIVKYRRQKGIQWEHFLNNMELLLNEEDNIKSYPIPINRQPYEKKYLRLHKKLITFYRNAIIDADEILLNRYLRIENIILTGHYYKKSKELNLRKDEKCLLAQVAKNLHGFNSKKMSIITPKEIITYTRKKPNKNYCYSSNEKKVKSIQYISTQYLREIISSIIKDNHYSTRNQVFNLAKEYFGNKISDKRIFDILHEFKFFTEKKKINSIHWNEFKKKYADVTWAGDFFSVNVFSRIGIITYQVMFFVHLATGEVFIAGASDEATSEWVINMIKSWTDAESPFGSKAKFLIRDCDRRYTKEVDWYFTGIGLLPRKIIPKAPVMNCQAESFVHHIKSECLNQLSIFSEKQLQALLKFYQYYYNNQRPNSKMFGGYIMKNNEVKSFDGQIKSESILPGILNYYYRA